MNWIISSLIMFGASVCLYLMIRKSSLLKNPTQFNNLAMFLIPLMIYAVIGIVRGIDYSITPIHLLEIVLMAFVFSYLGNVSSLKSIELAPNPGYSLVLSKSYVVFTTLISVLFLGGELTVRKTFAIILVVMFSAMVTIDPSKTVKKKTDLKWFWYAMFSFFAWGFLSLAIKYLSIQGVNTLVMLTYLYFFVSFFILFETYRKKLKYDYSKSFWLFFVGIGVFSSLFNYFNFYSVSIAPNVGYVNAINASSISMVAIFSALLFKDHLSSRKIIGILGVTVGLLLLIL